MPGSLFKSRNFGVAQAKLSELASMDAQSLLDRANYVAPGRYRSLFQTHLETAMMFLNKAIAFDGVTETPQAADNPPTTFDDDESTSGNWRLDEENNNAA